MTALTATPFFAHLKEEWKENLNGNSEEDVLLGAYLMSHLRPCCENCGTDETPQWRKGWYSDVLNRCVFLCNACGIKFQKNQFCSYCFHVYGKQYKTSNVWLVCSTCGRCVHTECETKYGAGAPDFSHAYACPECRKHSSHSS